MSKESNARGYLNYLVYSDIARRAKKAGELVIAQVYSEAADKEVFDIRPRFSELLGEFRKLRANRHIVQLVRQWMRGVA